MKQQTLFKIEKKEFGGSLLENKRKTKRMLSPNCPIHLIFKADISKSKSLLKHKAFIDCELEKWSDRFNVEIMSRAICADHIHLEVRFVLEKAYKNFVRTFTARTAQTLKVKWTTRPYTRIVGYGKAEFILRNYIQQNHEEAMGLRQYKPRSRIAKKDKSDKGKS